MKRLLFLPVVLAGCTMHDTPTAITPISAVLYQDTVTVQASDGTLCTGPRNQSGNQWSGQLGGCPHAWPYQVLRNTPRPRLPLAPGVTGSSGITINTSEGPIGFSG